ncbi:MAG: ester cyclase [Candidatus Odyssella sp.]|nr:ester cyclase [Candidatus Odyssella sp.]
MPDTDLPELRARREAVIRAHAEAENRHDVEATLRTFDHPRYEVVPLGDPIDGADNVRDLLAGLFAGFPDFCVEIERLHHGDGAVTVEARIRGTHRGPWAGIPATGRRIDVPALSLFLFDGDRLACEKVYFDMATLMRQLGAA